MYANSGRSLVPLFFLTICIKISLKKKVKIVWNKSLGCSRQILDPCLPYTSCKFSSTCNFITEFNQIKCGIVVMNQLIILNMKNACQYLSVYLYYIHVEHWKKKNYIYKDTLNNILVLLYLE